MNPPFVSAPLTPSLSNISASFDFNKSIQSAKNSHCIAKVALINISQSQQSEKNTRSGRSSPQTSSSDTGVRASNATSISPNSKGSQWSTLVSKQIDSSKKRSPSLNLELRASLLSAPSDEQLSTRPPKSSRKLSPSEPRDTPNLACNMHRRPVTACNRAGSFYDPVCRESSGFGNPAVAAAEERWKRGKESHLDMTQNAQEAIGDEPCTWTRRKPSLSIPRDIEKISSPKLHFRGYSTSGVFTEWICREQSGFANPTYAASTQRWKRSESSRLVSEATVESSKCPKQAMRPASSAPPDNINSSTLRKGTEVDEREGQERINGLPATNSRDMDENHIMLYSNCFGPTRNGFGTPEMSTLQAFDEPLDVKLHALISFCPVSTSRIEREDEYGQWSARGNKAALSMAASNQVVEARLSPSIMESISPYPVPSGLVAASIQAQRGHRFSKSSGESDHKFTEPMDR